VRDFSLRWIEPDEPVETGLEGSFPKPLLGILSSRGFCSANEIEECLNPKLKLLNDPFELPGMEDAVARILEALDKQEQIVVFGDYDVDGVTSTALLTLFFRQLGFKNVVPFLPHRMEEGYGLSAPAVRRYLENHTPGLFIAVDCGTNSIEEARLIKEAGSDVIILDHHEILGDGHEDVFSALVNPKLTGEYDYLCSVGIAFKVAHAILKHLSASGPEAAQIARSIDLKEYLDLVAVGTVADIVPLRGDNRILVSAGLKRLDTTPRPGLVALKDVCKINAPVGTYHIGFMIGPRLNAMGRLESAMESLNLLLCTRLEEARTMAVEMDQMNRERQAVELEVFHQAQEDAAKMYSNDPSINTLVLGRPDWHAGVVGIVASRILREFHLPTIVIGFDEGGQGKGSGRSIEGFHLVECLEECQAILTKFGGHAMAAGITITFERLEEFREAFDLAASRVLTAEMLAPKLKIDAELAFDEITPGFMDCLAKLEPFGNSHPEPVFIARNIQLASEPRFIGKDKKHLKLQLKKGSKSFDAIYFRFDQTLDLGKLQGLDIAFIPEWNHFRDEKTIQLKIKAIREHQPR